VVDLVRLEMGLSFYGGTSRLSLFLLYAITNALDYLIL
jgi:hypothetical protein